MKHILRFAVGLMFSASVGSAIYGTANLLTAFGIEPAGVVFGGGGALLCLLCYGFGAAVMEERLP